MGNSNSNDADADSEVNPLGTEMLGLIPPKDIRFISSEKLGPIACPPELLKNGPENSIQDNRFRRFLYQNLQYDYFLCSLIENSSDESRLLAGIDFFRWNEKEVRESAISYIKQNATLQVSGVQVLQLLNYKQKF